MSFFRDRSLQFKILSGFSIVLLLLVMLAYESYTNVKKVKTTTRQLISHDLEVLMLEDQLSANIQEGIALTRGYLLHGDAEYKGRLIQVAQRSGELNMQLIQRTQSEELKTLVSKSEQFGKLLNEQVIPTFESGNREEALTIMSRDVTPIAREISDGFKQVALKSQADMKQAGESLLDSGSKLETKIILFSIVSIVLGVIIALLISRIIVNPILQVVRHVKFVSQGDLTQEAIKSKSKDEVGMLTDSINTMVDNLRILIQQVNETTQQVAAASEELSASADQTNKATEHISSTMQEVAAGAEDQVRGIQETSQVIDEMSSSLLHVTKSIEHVSAQSTENLEKANAGSESIKNAEQQMNSIQSKVEGLSTVVKQLGDRSQQIGSIIEVITGIAGQTNLLALNAAIEAARAGEHGRGFAVVADEVRKLAEQTAYSAQQITQLIVHIQEETHKAVTSMNSVTSEVTNGIEVVQSAGESFSQIEQVIHGTTKGIGQVSDSIQQMATGVQEVVQSINTISRVVEESAAGSQSVSAATEQQVASMEEILASASSLTSMAGELQIFVGKFKVN